MEYINEYYKRNFNLKNIMRRQVFFTGTLIALMLLVASTTAFAQGLSITNEEARAIKTEIKEGKPVKEVLEKHNITMGQVRSALTQAGGFEHNGKKLTNTQIANLAETLNLDPELVQDEIEAGKSLQEILQANDITPEQVRDAMRETKQNKRQSLQDRRELMQERNQTFKERMATWREDWKESRFSLFKKRQ